MIIIGHKTRCITHRTVDVKHQSAVTTDKVVMVIANSIFVSGNRPRWLYATNQALLDEDAQCVVHGLTRDRTNTRPHGLDQFVGCCMRMC